MKDEYAVYKKFPTIEQVKEIESLLNENHIETIIGDNIPPVDTTFTGNDLISEFEIRIKQSEFEKANAILEKDCEISIEDVDKDYYLLKFRTHHLQVFK